MQFLLSLLGWYIHFLELYVGADRSVYLLYFMDHPSPNPTQTGLSMAFDMKRENLFGPVPYND
jgi:hypothetical protein